jgi:hypothetical protein
LLLPLVKSVDLHPGDEAKMHWALWTFPTFSNAEATKYLTDNAAATRAQIKKLFP